MTRPLRSTRVAIDTDTRAPAFDARAKDTRAPAFDARAKDTRAAIDTRVRRDDTRARSKAESV